MEVWWCGCEALMIGNIAAEQSHHIQLVVNSQANSNGRSGNDIFEGRCLDSPVDFYCLAWFDDDWISWRRCTNCVLLDVLSASTWMAPM